MFHHVLMFSIAIIGKGFDRNASTRVEQSDDLQIFGIHQFDQILHDDVDAVFVEIAVVAETEEVEFQALTLHHACARDIIDDNMAEIGLTSLGTQ